MFYQKAFTLIEMIIVLVIVGILVIFVVFQVNNSINAGKDVKRKADIELLANAVVSYSTDHYSSKPISTNCTLGETCSSEIEDALKSYLPTLPNDPNSGTYYNYQSNGNDCNISANLSDGTSYFYSCSTEQFVVETPIAGVCGSSSIDPNNNFYLTSEITNPCLAGNVSTITTALPVTDYFKWTCNGIYGGSFSSQCTANLKIDGACSIGLSYSSAPSNGSCVEGVPTVVTGEGPWYWDCNGLNGGINTTNNACSANLSGYSFLATAGTGGTVSCAYTSDGIATSCSATYPAGTSITVTATPSGSYVFSSWLCSGGTCSPTTTSPSVVTISANTTVNARFTVYSNVTLAQSPQLVSVVREDYPTYYYWATNPNFQGVVCGNYSVPGWAANSYYCPTTVGSNVWSCVGYSIAGSSYSGSDYQGVCCPSGKSGLMLSSTTISSPYPSGWSGTNATWVCVPN